MNWNLTPLVMRSYKWICIPTVKTFVERPEEFLNGKYAISRMLARNKEDVRLKSAIQIPAAMLIPRPNSLLSD